MYGDLCWIGGLWICFFFFKSWYHFHKQKIFTAVFIYFQDMTRTMPYVFLFFDCSSNLNIGSSRWCSWYDYIRWNQPFFFFFISNPIMYSSRLRFLTLIFSDCFNSFETNKFQIFFLLSPFLFLNVLLYPTMAGWIDFHQAVCRIIIFSSCSLGEGKKKSKLSIWPSFSLSISFFFFFFVHGWLHNLFDLFERNRSLDWTLQDVRLLIRYLCPLPDY